MPRPPALDASVNYAACAESHGSGASTRHDRLRVAGDHAGWSLRFARHGADLTRHAVNRRLSATERSHGGAETSGRRWPRFAHSLLVGRSQPGGETTLASSHRNQASVHAAAATAFASCRRSIKPGDSRRGCRALCSSPRWPGTPRPGADTSLPLDLGALDPRATSVSGAATLQLARRPTAASTAQHPYRAYGRALQTGRPTPRPLGSDRARHTLRNALANMIATVTFHTLTRRSRAHDGPLFALGGAP